MTADITKSVLFNDGEQLEPSDLNNAQRFLLSLLCDGVVSLQAPHLNLLSEPGIQNTTHLYAIGDSGAPYEDGAGTRTPNFLRGVVAHRPGAAVTPDGNDPQCLLYYLTENEPQVARPAVVTNPRWDIVSLALAQANAVPTSRDFQDAATRALTTSSFNKQRQVTATITWTQGVEAVTPIEPATPAGQVKLAAFLVTPAMTVFDPTTDIRDYRMPLGPVSMVDVPGHLWAHRKGEENASELDTGSLRLIASAGATAICTLAGSSKRVVTIGLGRVTGTIAPASLDLVRLTALGLTPGTLRDLLSIYAGAASYTEFDILASHGAPLWANGFSAGYACGRLAGALPGSESRLGLRMVLGSAGPIVSLARFVLVG